MNKTVTITLSGIIFHIEEDAYFDLQEYLDSIKKYFKDTNSVDEMINDIEMSIAEKFNKKINGHKKVITKIDVEKVVEIMGTVEEFASDDLSKSSKDNSAKEQEIKEKNDDKIKKLYRNSEDVIIGGVCSGIAEYFGIDPVFVRLFFVASIFLGGTGLWIYIILWIVMPMAKTNSQKLEMKGSPVTLKKLEEVIKKKVKEGNIEESKEKINSGFKRVINFFIDILKMIINFFKNIFPLFRLLIGLVVFIGSIFVITAFMFLAGVMLFKINSPYLNPDFPINEIIGNLNYYLWISSSFLVLSIPFLFLIFLGIGIIRKKKILNFLSSSFLFAIWLISLVSFGVISIEAVPKIKDNFDSYIEKHQVTKDYYLENVDNFEFNGNFDVIMTRGENSGMAISGKDVDIDNIEIISKDKKLEIYKKEKNDKDFCIFCADKRIKIEISNPLVKKIKAKNSTFIEMNNFLIDDLKIDLENYAKVDFVNNDLEKYQASSSLENFLEVKLDNGSKFFANQLNLKKAIFDIDNYSRVSLEGIVDRLELSLNDYSKFEGFDFVSLDALVRTDNYSEALVEVKNNLEAYGRNYSEIIYKGNPEIIDDFANYSSLRSY